MSRTIGAAAGLVVTRWVQSWGRWANRRRITRPGEASDLRAKFDEFDRFVDEGRLTKVV